MAPKRLNRLRNPVDMRLHPRSLLRRLGVDIVRYPSRQRDPLPEFLRRFEIDCVLDVGANEGQYGQSLRDQGFAGRIVSFEPNPDAFARLAARSAGDARWECHNIGLGAEEGEAVLRVSELSVFSSMLAPTAYIEDLDPRARTQAEVVVPIQTLSRFWDKHHSAARNPLLKIDTQGYEKPVLIGAERILPQVRGLQLELSLRSIYSSQPTIEEIIPFVREKGFPLYAAWSGYFDEATGAVLEMDGLFLNERFRPDAR